MALTIDESWVRERLKLKHDHLDDVKSLSLPGTYQEKITSVGKALRGFTRLKNLDLSRNSIDYIEGLENLQLLENLNLYYNNISTIRDLNGLRHLKNLKELDLRLNPVTKNEPDYRLHIVHMLPNLKRLDDRSVRDSERRAAILHFTSDQASDFNGNIVPPSNMKMENERLSIPRADMVRNLGPRNAAFEDDDVAILDMITRTGGDLNQPRRVTGSSSRQPDLEDFTRDEIYNMQPIGTPRKHRTDNLQANRNKRSPSHAKDRVYVQFADDFPDNPEQHLKYTDESSAYSTLNTRGHFTANPLINDNAYFPSGTRSQGQAVNHRNHQGAGQNVGHPQEPARTYDFFSPEKRQEQRTRSETDYDRNPDPGIPLSARPYDVSPMYGSKPRQTSPRQSQGPLADKIGQFADDLILSPPSREFSRDEPSSRMLEADTAFQSSSQTEILNKLVDLVDRYWNGSKSLHRHSKFQSIARKLLFSPSSLNQPSTPGSSDMLQAELSERTMELSRLRDQMAEQQRELESMRSKMKAQDTVKSSLETTSQELAAVTSRLKEVQEENGLLNAKAASLEARNLSATEQEKQLGELLRRNNSLEDKVHSFNQQMSQQNNNLEQLQELTNMLQESHRSLVATNDHLLRELDETHQRHASEVHQMHWSYDKLKNAMDWLPNGTR